jgi:hypothetical protein
MSEQIVQQRNGHTAPAPAPASPKASPTPRRRLMVVGGLLVAGLLGFGVWHFFLAGSGAWQIPPICAIGLVFYTLAWRATRRMQVNA